MSVDAIVIHDLPNDLLLVGSSLVLALLIAIPLGVLQAVRRNKLTDYAATGVSFVLYSMPSYLLGLLLIALFAVNLRLLPGRGAPGPNRHRRAGRPGWPGAACGDTHAGHLRAVQPVHALCRDRQPGPGLHPHRQGQRARSARGAGQAPLRNSLIPVTTLVGISLPGILTFGLIVEQLFNFPGIGLEYYNAAVTGDYPVVFGVTVLVALATVVGNLFADIVYVLLDPRVRYD